MSNIAAKKVQALAACEKVINGIEDGEISVSSALLLCKKIARLVNDQDGLQWLNYEHAGYPTADNGKILREAWQIGAAHGRHYQEQGKDGKQQDFIFIELCKELEASIDSDQRAINNYTTQGYSASGDYAHWATNNMANAVFMGTNNLRKNIKTSERRLSILKAQYYDYAVKWQIELQFGNTAQSVFEEYQTKVDSYFTSMPTSTLQKLNAIEDLMEDGNPERYAQVLTSCRRLWSETAKQLFEEVLPNYTEKTFKTKSGKDIDISGDHDNNKLSAVIETLQAKATKNTLVGSETLYLIDWMEQINNRQSTGVHSDVTREQAMQCIIHTYIALGDILSLRANVGSAVE